ncbi:MauE/DoxX family redox-associated membrane protein [Ferruginibacter sp. SUN106]|uniref:MauE/DoxX family redox-associated membrane protein n=1 Tax=Ferruginibacter sp. SUN106 TaxID=2978348 RepID=UPI003D359EE7
MFLLNYKRISTVINFLLVLLFVYTGTSKLLGHQVFKEQLEQLHFLQPLGGFISVTLPVTEIISGLAIAFKPTMRWGLWLAALLMTIFTAYVGFMLAGDNTKLPCSCGGVMKAMSWKTHLWFNILFTLLAWANIYLTDIRKRE